MSDSILEVRDLRAGYGDVSILWGVDFTLRRGEITCLVGSNGAGKTTLLRCLSGLIRRGSGQVVFDGEDLDSDPRTTVARGLIHVPEGRRLFPTMSVTDNLLMGAYLRRDGAAAIRRDLDLVFSIFPRMAERRHQDASTMSGGEQQMCAIGRGLMARPKLLMIDELSLGLAPKVVEDLVDILKRINQAGISLLVVEQDVMSALEFSDQAIVLDQGRVVEEAPSRALLGSERIRQAYFGS